MSEALLALPMTARVELEPPRRPTAAEALELHGFTWERLEKLARRALDDRMRHRRIVLDEARYSEALDWYVEVGARKAIEFDPERGVGFATYLYRRMYPRLHDYLRKRHGDERRGQPLTEVASERLPELPGREDDSFELATATLATRLPPRARWTLEHLGRPLAEGLTLRAAALRAGIDLELAEELLEELGWRLGRKPPQPDADSDDWLALLEMAR